MLFALLPNTEVWGFWIILQLAATQRTLHKFSVQTKWLHRSTYWIIQSSRLSQVKNLQPKKNLCCTRLVSCTFLPSRTQETEKVTVSQSRRGVLGVVGSDRRVRAQSYVTWVVQRGAGSTNLSRVSLQSMVLSCCSTNLGFALLDLIKEITSTLPQEFVKSHHLNPNLDGSSKYFVVEHTWQPHCSEFHLKSQHSQGRWIMKAKL